MGSSRLLLFALIFTVPVRSQGRMGIAKLPDRQKLQGKSIKCKKKCVKNKLKEKEKQRNTF